MSNKTTIKENSNKVLENKLVKEAKEIRAEKERNKIEVLCESGLRISSPYLYMRLDKYIDKRYL